MDMEYWKALMDCFFFSSRRRHTRFDCDWSSDVCSSDLFFRKRSCVKVLGHSCAGDKFGHQIVGAVLREELMDRLNIGVIQFGEGERLFAEALASTFVIDAAGWQDLYGHIAVQLLIVGSI